MDDNKKTKEKGNNKYLNKINNYKLRHKDITKDVIIN